MANTNGFVVMPEKKVKGRNAVDQSLFSSHSLNQSSYATEGRSLQMIDRSMNADSQLDHSIGGHGGDVRTRVVARPKSKKSKLHASNSTSNQIKQ